MTTKQAKNFILSQLYIDEDGNPNIPDMAVEQLLSSFTTGVSDIEAIVNAEANRQKHEDGTPIFLSECRKRLSGYDGSLDLPDFMPTLQVAISDYLRQHRLYWIKRREEEIARKGKPYCHNCRLKLPSKSISCPHCLNKELDKIYAT